MIKPLLIALSAVLVVPNFFDRDIQSMEIIYDGKERFSPQLSFLNSIGKLEKFTDASASDKSIAIGSVAYVELLENIISHRFYNGPSHKSLSQDWITPLTDRIAGTSYSRLVTGDEILQHPQASASQQAIVIMELLKRKKIVYRQNGFPGVSVVQALINGKWHKLDHGDNLQAEVSPVIEGEAMTALIQTNKSGLYHLETLQDATGVLSKILWTFPLVFAFLYKKRPYKMYALKPVGKYVRMQTLRPVYNS